MDKKQLLSRLLRNYSMRFHFEPQLELGTKPIANIEFDLSSRHELIPLLVALQHIFVTNPEAFTPILNQIQNDIGLPENPKLGCKGMSMWEILILTAVRLGCDLDFDALSDLASNHRALRQMMFISDWNTKKVFKRSTIHENLFKLKPVTLKMINDFVVSEGHKQCADPLEKVRCDSFVLQKNIHYPTDSNLLLDACRKLIQLSKKIADLNEIPGWRKGNYLYKKIKKEYRKLTRIAKSRSKDRDERLRTQYLNTIELAEMIIGKSLLTLDDIKQFDNDKDKILLPLNKWQLLVSEIHYYLGGLDYIVEMIRTRVFKNETIPNTEKVFSLFEPDTELINRGKSPNPIEFGHRVLIVQDSAGFIIGHDIMGNGITDEKNIVVNMEALQNKYQYQIKAASFDKGFWSKDNLTNMSEFIDLVVLPKKGRHSIRDIERETSKEFVKIRKWHSGVESAIGALQAGNGLKVCRDKGIDGYRRYFSMAVLGRNLCTLGNIIMEKERKKRNKASEPLDRLIIMAA